MALGTDLGTGMPDGAEAHYRASGETAGHKSRLFAPGCPPVGLHAAWPRHHRCRRFERPPPCHAGIRGRPDSTVILEGLHFAESRSEQQYVLEQTGIFSQNVNGGSQPPSIAGPPWPEAMGG